VRLRLLRHLLLGVPRFEGHDVIGWLDLVGLVWMMAASQSGSVGKWPAGCFDERAVSRNPFPNTVLMLPHA